MANLSDNLGLTLPDPKTDGDEAFNLETMYNWNLRKIDAAVGDLNPSARKLGLTSTNIAGILTALADRLIDLENKEAST